MWASVGFVGLGGGNGGCQVQRISGRCQRRRQLVVVSKYYVQYDQSKPDRGQQAFTNADANDHVAFVLQLLRNGELEYARTRLVEKLKDLALPCKTYVRLITSFGAFDSESGAEAVHRLAKWRLGVEHHQALDRALLKVYGKLGSLDKLRSMFERMPRGCPICHCTAIKAVAAAGLVDEAERYLLEDLRCYNELLHVLASRGEHERALNLVKKIDTSGQMRRDVRTYNILLSLADNVGEAHALLTGMKADRIALDVVTYSTLIGLLTKWSRVQDAMVIYAQMRSVGVRPNVVTMNTLVFALANAGLEEESEQMLREMEALRIRPNTATYNQLIKSQIERGELQLGRNLFEVMGKGSFRHLRDVYTYNIMLAGYAAEGKVYAAERMFARMIRSNVKPNEVTYRTMMHAHMRRGKPFAVRKYLRMMKQNGVAISERAMSAMAVSWAREGNIEGAKAVLRDMRRQGMEPSVHALTAILRAHVSKGDLGTAQVLFQSMCQEGPAPTVVTCNVLVGAYAKRGLVVEAENVLSSVPVAADVITFTALVGAYGYSGAVEGAEGVFERMRACQVQPNERTYTALMSCYRKAEEWEKAEGVVAQMKADGIRPDAFVHGSLVAMYAERSDAGGALACHRQLLNDGVEPSRVGYITLLYALFKADRKDCAHALIDEAEEHDIQLPKRLYNTQLSRQRRRQTRAHSKPRTHDAASLRREALPQKQRPSNAC